MTAFQSTLGEDGDDIAVELASNQREISIAEFFEKNKHMLGFDSGARALVTATKEAVDNSLDATEEAGYLPDIYVEIEDRGDYYGVIIEDNGPGITEEEIPKVFGKLLYGSRFHVREQSLTPDQRIIIRHDGEITTVPIGSFCDSILSETGPAVRREHRNVEVPAFNRETGEMTWQPVTHVIRHETDEQTYRIETKAGPTVEVTGNHSLFTRMPDGDPKEVAAASLTPGDRIVAPNRLPEPVDPIESISLPECVPAERLREFGIRIEDDTLLVDVGDTLPDAGRWSTTAPDPLQRTSTVSRGFSVQMSDGEVTHEPGGSTRTEPMAHSIPDGRPAIEGTDDVPVPATLPIDRPLLAALAAYLRAGSADSVDPVARAGDCRWRHPSVLSRVFGAMCGEEPANRRLPNWVFELKPSHRRHFLTHLCPTLISNDADERSHFEVQNEELARGVSILLGQEGILATASRTLPTESGSKDEERYTLTVSAVSEGGADEPSDLCSLEVQQVTPTDSPEWVYDISVPGESGVDENFVVWNDGPISVKNSRGQQGIGISAAVLYSQLTSGKPAMITSRTAGGDAAKYFELVIDTDSNEPEIRAKEETVWDRPHGTRIELEMEANMRARTQLHDYILQTAVVNPHARIEFQEPKGSFKFERATDELPAETEAIRPHPHGVELGTIIKMLDASSSRTISGFLQEEFTRVGRKTAAEIIDGFRDRHHGRAVPWTVNDPTRIEQAVADATANKSKSATAAFATSVAEQCAAAATVAHFEVEEIVEDTGETVGAEHGETFGKTVREKAVEAAWKAITTTRRDDLYKLVNAATSSRKDDETIAAIADRLTEKFETAEDPRDRCRRDGIREYVDRAADMAEDVDDITFGDTARENVVEALWTRMRTVPDDVPSPGETAADRDTARQLVDAMRSANVMAPPTNCLAPISAELVEAGLRKEYDADFYTAATRSADVHAGDPFIAEAGIAYGGDLDPEGGVDVLRFANRVPLVYQRGACAITDVVKSIGWRNYELDQPGGSGIPQGPAVIMVHVASTNVPFTSESKDAIANIPAIEDEIELAIREAARELKSYLNKRRSLEQRQRKQSALTSILPEMAEKLAEVTDRDRPNIDDALARIMNNVLVERHVEDGLVSIVVENHGGRTESLEITEIVSAEPSEVGNGATVVEMDDEWYVQWKPEVPDGDTARLEYTMAADDATFDIDVKGVAAEKLTIATDQ